LSKLRNQHEKSLKESHGTVQCKMDIIQLMVDDFEVKTNKKIAAMISRSLEDKMLKYENVSKMFETFID
jgi:hypothetical protein